MTRLDLVVGPNGAGKSTFVRLVVGPEAPSSAFVDADEIAARRWPDDPVGHSYAAAEIAAETRATLIERRHPFIAETVFSHPSKLDLIRSASDAGYHVALHVVMVPEELAVARVAARVAAGGHRVPEDKVRARWGRLWRHVVAAVDLVDTAHVWDNSHHEGPTLVAQFSGGLPVVPPEWPPWAPAELTAAWPST